LSRINAVTPEHFDDPVAAYDRLAVYYADLSRRREPYLRGIEREIISRIPPRTPSLLDVGAGDGARGLRIASHSGIERVVLVEPSRGMAGRSIDHAEVWPVRAEDLPQQDETRTAEKFAVVICLWNVLGHVPSEEKRRLALRAISLFLSPNGKFFLDVNHRYNLRSYGIFPTGARWVHDLFRRNENAGYGDVPTRWHMNDARISTYGHVFTHGEIMRLAEAAGLKLEERLVVDYESGESRRFAFQGNLFYVFRRSSRIDSSTAPQTS
jgi:2-polyprenyl-3-methyl-5-hydroxy-6-metoxy-1,4-benzoquinol methylase